MIGVILCFEQTLILGIYILLGYLSNKAGLISERGAGELSAMILYTLSPPMIFNAFLQVRPSAETSSGLVYVFFFSLLCHLLAILISRPLFRNSRGEDLSLLRYALVFSNAGFFTLPLLQALLGPKGVFYGSVYIAVFNLFNWTWGLRLMRGKWSGGKKPSLFKLLLNPNIVSLFIGLCLFFSQPPLPELLLVPIRQLAGAYSPMAMLVLGAQIASFRPGPFWKEKQLWRAAFGRNLLVPLLLLAAAALLPSRELALACLLPAAAPSAANLVLFSTLYRKNVRLAVGAVLLSTLLALLTVPLVTLLGEEAWRLLHP